MAHGTDRETSPGRLDPRDRRHRWTPWFPLVIIAIGLAVFGNTYNIPFYLDDNVSIRSNPSLWDWGYFIDFSKVELAVLQGRLPANFMTSIVSYFTLAVNYHLHSFSLTGYHIFNLAAHLCNGLLVYWLLLHTLKLPGSLKGPKDRSGYSVTLSALAVALVFTIHPVQTQAVNYISQRSVLLVTIFSLLSLIAFIRWRLADTISEDSFKTRSDESSSWKKFGWYWLAVASALLAMLSKEVSFTLPVVILLYDRLFLNSLRRPPWLTLVPFVFVWAVIPAILLWQGSEWYEGVSSLSTSFESGWIGNLSYRYLLTLFPVLVAYLRLFLRPSVLRLDYDFPRYESFLQLPVLASFFLIALIGGLAFACYLRSRNQVGERRVGLRLLTFGICWFCLAILVESISMPLGGAFFEHRMYQPMIGVLISILGLFVFFREKLLLKGAKLLIFLLLPILLTLAVSTYSRNALWADPIAFWEDNLARSPGKGLVHYNLAEEYKRVGRIDEAIAQYKAAISSGSGNNGESTLAYKTLNSIYHTRGENELVRENSENALKDLQEASMELGDNKVLRNEEGVLLGDLRRWQEAEQAFRTASELDPAYAMPYMNLGRLYLLQRRPDQALSQVQEAVRLDPDSPIIQESLGDVLQAKGSNASAAEAYRRSMTLDPNNRNIYLKLAYQHARLGDSSEGELVLQKAVELWPEDPKLYNDLGLFLARHKKLAEAEETYLKALEINRDNFQTLMNLGVLNRQTGQIDKAIDYYRKSLALNTQNRYVYYNLGLALMEKGEYEEAGQLFMTALSFDPNDQDVLRQLGEIMYLEEMQRRAGEQGMTPAD